MRSFLMAATMATSIGTLACGSDLTKDPVLPGDTGPALGEYRTLVWYDIWAPGREASPDSRVLAIRFRVTAATATGVQAVGVENTAPVGTALPPGAWDGEVYTMEIPVVQGLTAHLRFNARYETCSGTMVYNFDSRVFPVTKCQVTKQ